MCRCGINSNVDQMRSATGLSHVFVQEAITTACAPSELQELRARPATHHAAMPAASMIPCCSVSRRDAAAGRTAEHCTRTVLKVLHPV